MATRLPDFVDIHVHILPGIDDGPKDMANSLTLARSYEHAGISRIFATPHFIPGTAWSADKETVLQLVSEFQAVLDSEGINLHIIPGMEIAYHRKMVERICSGQLLSLGNSNYYLIEPPFYGIAGDLYGSLMYLLEREMNIIIAHPERAEIFIKKPRLIEKLFSAGAHIQINSGSLLGYFGVVSKQIALNLWESRQLHYIASDAHNCNNRTPLTRVEWDSIRYLPDGEVLLNTCSNNSRLLTGQ